MTIYEAAETELKDEARLRLGENPDAIALLVLVETICSTVACFDGQMPDTEKFVEKRGVSAMLTLLTTILQSR